MKDLFRNKRGYLKCIVLLFVASALSSCDKHTVYHSFQSIPQKGWAKQDTLAFDVIVPDSQTYYKLSIEVRNRNNYPYQNLNLSISYDGPEINKLPADTVKATLANKEGIWQGDGWGGLYQSTFSIGSVKIGKSGNYIFKVAYTLPDEILPGINDIGIKLER